MNRRILAVSVLLLSLPAAAFMNMTGVQGSPTITVIKPTQSRPDTKDHVDVLTAHAAQLRVLVTAANGDTIATPITWSITDPSIATVSKTGIVTGKLTGTTTVTATSSTLGLSGQMLVCVSAVGNTALIPKFAIGKADEIMIMNFDGTKASPVSADSLNLIPQVIAGTVSMLKMVATYSDGRVATPQCVHWRNKLPLVFDINQGLMLSKDSAAHAFKPLPMIPSIGTIIP